MTTSSPSIRGIPGDLKNYPVEQLRAGKFRGPGMDRIPGRAGGRILPLTPPY
ncbi:MAG: hypothetical protein GX885_08990 [Methanomicrobiales archaeon]|nr:hypothetical protein [Methanomicrobiales archaeon]